MSYIKKIETIAQGVNRCASPESRIEWVKAALLEAYLHGENNQIVNNDRPAIAGESRVMPMFSNILSEFGIR